MPGGHIPRINGNPQDELIQYGRPTQGVGSPNYVCEYLLTLMTWVMMDKDKPFWAALFAVLSFLVKGYGGIIGVLCLYYKSWYKVVFYSMAWFIVLNALINKS